VFGARDLSRGVTAFAPAFSQAVAQAVTQEFPLASVAPAFTYRYDATLGAFAQSTNVPGPLFSERALTLGKGQLNFGIGYSFVDFSTLNGDDLDSITSPGLFNAPDFDRAPQSPPLPIITLLPGETLFLAPVSASLLRARLEVNAHILVPTLRYGITENWDIGLTIPIVDTFLRVRNEQIPVADADPNRLRFAFARDPQGRKRDIGNITAGVGGDIRRVPFQQTARSAFFVRGSAGSATGVGDISLRTKYAFWSTETGGAALGLNLLLPSGEVNDFHGTDETHLSTLLYLSHVLWQRFEPHLNVGVDFNADDVDRSSLLYAVGATLLVGTNLGVVVDFIGRSEFGRLQVHVPEEGFYQGVALNRAPDTCTQENPCFVERADVFFPFLPLEIKRNDIVDFSFGLRYALGTAGSIVFGGTIPLNNDGLRADFIPSGGFEYTF
jgi:hypothetical protein